MAIGAYGYTTGILLCPKCHDTAPIWAGERSSSRPILVETLRVFYAGAKAPCCDNCGASLVGASHGSIEAAILAAEELDYE